jgi:K+-transporting ATPase ATPase A chain
MLGVWLMGLVASLHYEHKTNPLTQTSYLEGKETRFTLTESMLWATATTVASNGSVNSMHSSTSPISGLVQLFNMMLGEIIFGGVGSGLYGMILFIILTIFLCGLMVGRTPEYLGKKIEALDMKYVLIALILPSCTVLLGTVLSLVTDSGIFSRANLGPHGLSEILYAWTSAANNNGSAFAGLNANTYFYNLLLALAMLIGRFGVIIPVMLIAENITDKKVMLSTEGRMSTDSIVFACMLIGVIVIVGALTFVPVLLLGPGLEHLVAKLHIGF